MKKNWLILYLLFPLLVFGQQEGYIHLKVKYIKVDKPIIQIDTLSIQPFYFEIFTVDNQPISKDTYHIDFVSAKLYFYHFKQFQHQIITVKFLEYPAYYRKTYQKYNPEIYVNDTTQSISLQPQHTYQPKPFEGLKTAGSVSRGLQAGNNQSLVMQSGLDLRIEGKLSDKIKVKAVLSDNNMPQAYAGISKSYKEFDRIYMQLSGKKWQATGGDIMLKNTASYYLKFNRKTQGLNLKIGSDSTQVQISGGYVEGQFVRNRFQGVEGNQGPYLLKGKQGETYIFVIPNSEEVSVNGKVLQRGENKEYQINYETAELIFNPTFPITQNQRIVVAFNYSNQHYVRYLNHNTYKHIGKTLDYRIFTYYESDAKTQTLLFEPDAHQIQILKNSGDNLQNMWVLSAKETAYNENQILYKKITASPDYFQYTTLNEPHLYQVKFSFVGKNNGSYNIQKIAANGKIYEFVGLHNGDYEPVIKLTPPKNSKYTGVNFMYHPSDKTQINLEAILNHNDKNLFSTKDDADNLGKAIHLYAQQQLWQQKNTRLKTHLSYDFTHRQFESLDPYRSPEFLRQWQIDSVFGKQHLLDFGMEFSNKKQQIFVGTRMFQLRDSLQANQEYLQAQGNINRVKYISDWRYTYQNSAQNLQATFIHQKIAYNTQRNIFSATGHFENSIQKKENILDTLNYKYQYAKFKISNKDTSNIRYSFYYKREQNDSIFNNRFAKTNVSNNLGLSVKKQTQNTHIELFAQYRISDYLLQKKQKKYVNIKALWQQNYFHKLFSTKLSIESYNGNTMRDEVIFVETPAGQGTHLWNDYNGNGIKEINEFEVAIYSDQANYMRVILPSKKYIPTLSNSYAAQLIFNPAIWQKKKFMKRIFAVFQFNTTHQTIKNQKFTFVWRPKEALHQNTLWQQDVFFNRSKKKYNIHLTYRFLQQKQLLLIGKQSHLLEQYQLQIRHAFLTNLIWHQKYATGINNNKSENYTQKNYKLHQQEILERLEYKQTQASFSVFYHLKLKENNNGLEYLTMHKFGLSYFYKNKKDNIFNVDLQYVKNNLKGNYNSPVAFQMLEGLQSGRNLVLSTLYRQKINSFLVMNLNYNFRLSEKHTAIHTGGIQLKMIF